MSTPILPFATWDSGTNQNSIPANDNALRAEILQRNVNNATTAQPVSPTDGDTYIIQSTHTGTQWATFTPKDLAIYKSGTWYAFAPVEGVRVSVSGVSYIYTSGAWTAAGGTSASASGLPNMLINGGFQINQLQVSGSVVLTAGSYGHDGWKAGASGCTYTFATSGGITTLTISAGSLIQVVEGANLKTGTYTMTWTGTATGKVASGSFTTTGAQGSFTGGTNGQVEFSTGTVSGVCLVEGTLPQAYAYMGFAVEFRRCQRYCYRPDMSGGAASPFFAQADISTASFGFVSGTFPVQMYARPTLTAEGGLSHYAVFGAQSTLYKTVSAMTLNNVSTKEFFLLDTTFASGLTPLEPAYLTIQGGSSLLQTLRFDARL